MKATKINKISRSYQSYKLRRVISNRIALRAFATKIKACFQHKAAESIQIYLRQHLKWKRREAEEQAIVEEIVRQKELLKTTFKVLAALVVEKKKKASQQLSQMTVLPVSASIASQSSSEPALTIQTSHYPILARIDFWRIAPEEGKFKMAAIWHNERKKARVLLALKFAPAFEVFNNL